MFKGFGKGKGKGKDKGWGQGAGKGWSKDGGNMMEMMMAKGGKGKMQEMMMEMMMATMMAKGGAAGGAGGGGGHGFSYKNELKMAFDKTHKDMQLTKETCTYGTTESENGGYTSTISCEKFSSDYEGEGASMKAAEDAAAQAALEGEFPDYAAAVKKPVASNMTVGDWGTGFWGAPAEKSQLVKPWRDKLNHCFAKHHKKVDKESIVYESTQVEGEKFQYISVVSSEKFSSDYTGEPGKGKKEADDNAAMVALEAEFPEDYAIIAPTMPDHKGLKRAFKAQSDPGSDGKKRKKGPKGEPVEQDTKSKLMIGVTLLSSESMISKGMVEYDTTEEDDTTTAIVTIKCLGGGPLSFKGEAAAGTTKASKKEAELSAAQAALDAFQDRISVAEEENITKKWVKKAERRAMLEQKKEENAAKKLKTDE